MTEKAVLFDTTKCIACRACPVRMALVALSVGSPLRQGAQTNGPQRCPGRQRAQCLGRLFHIGRFHLATSVW